MTREQDDLEKRAVEIIEGVYIERQGFSHPILKIEAIQIIDVLRSADLIISRHSAPAVQAPHNSGERLPSSDAAEAGADNDCMAVLNRKTLDALTIQNIEYHDHIRDLEEALQIIARKKKMDTTAAASMKAIAISALTSQAQQDRDATHRSAGGGEI